MKKDNKFGGKVEPKKVSGHQPAHKAEKNLSSHPSATYLAGSKGVKGSKNSVGGKNTKENTKITSQEKLEEAKEVQNENK